MLVSYGLMGDIEFDLIKDDIITLNKEGRLESEINGYEQIAILQLVKDVGPQQNRESQGFSLNFYPPKSTFKTRERVKVLIDYDKLRELIDRGYIGTRWAFTSRLDIRNSAHEIT